MWAMLVRFQTSTLNCWLCLSPPSHPFQLPRIYWGSPEMWLKNAEHERGKMLAVWQFLKLGIGVSGNNGVGWGVRLDTDRVLEPTRRNLPEALQANALTPVPSGGQSHADRSGCPLQLNRWQDQGVGATSVKPLLGEQATPPGPYITPPPSLWPNNPGAPKPDSWREKPPSAYWSESSCRYRNRRSWRAWPRWAPSASSLAWPSWSWWGPGLAAVAAGSRAHTTEDQEARERLRPWTRAPAHPPHGVLGAPAHPPLGSSPP